MAQQDDRVDLFPVDISASIYGSIAMTAASGVTSGPSSPWIRLSASPSIVGP